MSVDLSVYQNLATTLPSIERLGGILTSSGLFGCSKSEQGVVLLLSMMVEGKSPLQIRREFHIAGSNLVDRSDAIVAKFRQAGGKHVIVERSPNCAAVKLTCEGQTKEFRLEWKDIEKEPWVLDNKGNLKVNYATPRNRMKMLWHRCVADGVSTMMPEAIAGLPIEDELAEAASGPALTLAATDSKTTATDSKTAATDSKAPPAPATPAPAAPPVTSGAPATTSAPAPVIIPKDLPAAAAIDPATGLLDDVTMHALASLIGRNVDGARKFAVMRGWMDEKTAGLDDWMRRIPVKKATSCFRQAESFIKACQPGEALP